MKWIKKIFSNKRNQTSQMRSYKGFSDFFINSSDTEKIKVFTEAARRANEDQKKVVEKAQLLPIS